jgi:EmrB/QacA subfamily drug resistance transporter
MSSPTKKEAGTVADRRRWLALAVVMTATFLDLVDVTIVNIAVPSVQRDLAASFSAIQWVTAGYALTFALGLITGGRLGDIYGRKRLFLVGMLGFALTSAMSGVAVSAEMLIAARLLQGATAALMVPQVLSIIHVTFPAEERGKVFGMFGAMLGLGAVSGPLIGAVLTELDLFGLSWRPIFLVNVPICALGIWAGFRYISESKAPRALKLDLVGVALATIGLLMLIYPLTQGREHGWPVWGFVSMALSVVVLALFVAYERAKSRKDSSPLVELSLFRIKSFAAGVGLQLAYGVVSGIFFLVWTLYMQLGLGWSPLKAGLTGVPFSVAASVASGLSIQLLVPKFGNRVLQAGAAIKIAGVLLYLWMADSLGGDFGPWQMVIPLTVMGVGMGLIVAPVTDAVLSEVPPDHSGSASGVINTVNQLGLAFGMGLTSVAFFTVVDAAAPGTPPAEVFSGAFVNSLWYIAAGLVVVFLLVFALPRSARKAEAAPAEPVSVH